MKGIGKNMGILLLSIAVISSAATFLMTQYLVESSSTNDVGFLMGHMTLKVIDENGYVKDYRQTDNVIVLAGWNATVQNLFSGDYAIDPDGGGPGSLQATAPSQFSHIAVGSDDGTTLTVDNTNMALGAELSGCPRSTLGVFSDGAIVSSGSLINVKLFGGFDGVDADCRFAINEAGLFNGTAAQITVMFARNTFTTVPALGASDFLAIEWDFTFTSPP